MTNTRPETQTALDLLLVEMRSMHKTYREQGWTWKGHETLDWLVGTVLRGCFRPATLQDPRFLAYCKERDMVDKGWVKRADGWLVTPCGSYKWKPV